jgi:hypothetical protein
MSTQIAILLMMHYIIGLCFIKINQLGQTIDTLNQVITNYPDATIYSLDNANEFGKTAAKCHYLIFFVCF